MRDKSMAKLTKAEKNPIPEQYIFHPCFTSKLTSTHNTIILPTHHYLQITSRNSH